ncbi:MAG: hypothetical protein HXY51_04310 [Nitrospirae bacterium]|nr:hypothetical protein [Nitrospirota bacterium]
MNTISNDVEAALRAFNRARLMEFSIDHCAGAVHRARGGLGLHGAG